MFSSHWSHTSGCPYDRTPLEPSTDYNINISPILWHQKEQREIQFFCCIKVNIFICQIWHQLRIVRRSNCWSSKILLNPCVFTLIFNTVKFKTISHLNHLQRNAHDLKIPKNSITSKKKFAVFVKNKFWVLGLLFTFKMSKERLNASAQN